VTTGNLSESVLKTKNNEQGGLDAPEPDLINFFGSIPFFFAGFTVACLFLRLFIADPLSLYAEVRSEKLSIAKQWAGVASVAAFGSSHVDSGFDPRVFDRSISANAEQINSINLGISGGSQTEQAVVAREYERLVSRSDLTARPHMLLLEANAGANFGSDFVTHPRSINIYNLDTLRLALQFSDPRLGVRRLLGRSVTAAIAYGLNFMNTGMLSSAIFRPRLNEQIRQNQTVDNRRGLSPPLPTTNDVAYQRNLSAQVDSLRSAPPTASPALITSGLCAEAQGLQIGTNSGPSYQVVYFVTPKLTDLQSYETYPDSIKCGEIEVPIVNVALPLVHPDLYVPSLWHDLAHLNERGAGVYTGLLAQALKSRLSPNTLMSP